MNMYQKLRQIAINAGMIQGDASPEQTRGKEEIQSTARSYSP